MSGKSKCPVCGADIDETVRRWNTRAGEEVRNA